jgi:steroid 5-alpha reductase family enzyme
MNAWILTGFGLNVAMIVMALAWAIARRIANAGCLDVAAAGSFAVLACFYAAIGTGDSLRRWLVAGMVTIWSLRLAALLALDIVRSHPGEPRRYLALRANFPKRPWLMFFGFSQYLAALVAVLSVPFAIACSNPAVGLAGTEIAALVLWLIAMVGHTAAIEPLKRLLTDRKDSSLPRDPNLSRYSLQPQYLPEWLVWLAYFLFVLSSPWGWTTFYCPLIMFYSLTTANALLPRPPDSRAESRSNRSERT